MDNGVAGDLPGDRLRTAQAVIVDFAIVGEAVDDVGNGVEQFTVFRRSVAEPEGQTGLGIGLHSVVRNIIAEPESDGAKRTSGKARRARRTFSLSDGSL